MNTRTAFDAKTALASNPHTRVISAEYDEEHFGNFLIAFSKEEVPLSFVLDRGELAICRGLDGSDECKTLLPAIYELAENELLTAVAASL